MNPNGHIDSNSTTFVAPLGDKPTLLGLAPSSYLINRFHIEFSYGLTNMWDDRIHIYIL